MKKQLLVLTLIFGLLSGLLSGDESGEDEENEFILVKQILLEYMGCYNDNPDDPDLSFVVFDHSSYFTYDFYYYSFYSTLYTFNIGYNYFDTDFDDMNMTIGYGTSNYDCSFACAKLGYLYSGTQNGTCRCGSSFGKYNRSTSGCSTPCENNFDYYFFKDLSTRNYFKNDTVERTIVPYYFNESYDYASSSVKYKIPGICEQVYDSSLFQERRICGGTLKNSIYKIKTVEKVISYSIENLGCYNFNNSAQTLFLALYSDFNGMTVEKCVNHCMSFNLNLVQLHNGYFCSCGQLNKTMFDQLDSCYSKSGFVEKSSSCDERCSGDSKSFCGGGGSYVYDYDSFTNDSQLYERWLYDYKYETSIYYINYKNLIKCKVGYGSPTGYEPNCERTIPTLPGRPTIQPITIHNDTRVPAGKVYFRCGVSCPAGVDCTKISGTVEWIDGSSFNQSSIVYDSKSKIFYSYINESDWVPHINSNLSCKYKLYYKNLEPPTEVVSNNYFSGLECFISSSNIPKIKMINGDQFSINEGDIEGYKIECINGLPILCDSNSKLNNCSLDFKLKIDSSENQLVSKNQCRQGFSPSQIVNLGKSISWNIVPLIQFKSIEPNRLTHNISIQLRGTNDTFSSFVRFLGISGIMLKFNHFSTDRNIEGNGKAFNDPHSISLDGRPLEMQKLGEFVMFENIQTQMRVHMLTIRSRKSEKIYLIDTVYIQSVNDFVSISYRDRTLFYTNLNNNRKETVKFYKTKCLTSTNGIIITRENGFFIIKSHYGTSVNINTDVSNFQIIPSKTDKSKVRGCFGNYNDDDKDDFKYLRNGTSARSGDAFIESFDALKNSDIPKLSKGQFYPFKIDSKRNGEDALTLNFCLCKDDFDSNEQNVCKPSLNAELFSPTAPSRRKRNVHENIELREIYKPTIIRDTLSIEACEQLKIEILETCNDLGIIDLDHLYSMCRFDYETIPNEDWISGYLKSAKDVCKTALINDESYWQLNVDNVKEPRVDLISQLCPNDCSSNGICSDEGECVCSGSFTGFDCSLDVTLPPSVIRTLYDNNTHYLTDEITQLTEVLLEVKNFIPDLDNSTVKCEFLADENTEVLGVTYLQPFTSSDEVVFVEIGNCVKNNYSKYTIRLSVSNDNESFSNSIYLNVLTKNTGSSSMFSTISLFNTFMYSAFLINFISLFI